MAVRKPSQDALRALTGGPEEQVEFLLLYNPMVLIGAITFGDQNVLIKKRELKALVASTWADMQGKRPKGRRK